MAAALRALMLTAVFLGPGAPLAAQTEISLTGLRQDTTLPVEATADTLSVNQTDGQATFTGNVNVKQGDMTITASEARLEYTPDGKGIDRIFFFGRVLFVSPTDAAEADEAVYTIATGEVILTGDVLLTQGGNTMSGARLVYNLDQGTGTMEGGVQTVFFPGRAKQ